MRLQPGRDTCYRPVNRVFISDDILLPRHYTPLPPGCVCLALLPQISWFPSRLTVDMDQACHRSQTRPHVSQPDPDIVQM